MCSEHTKFTNFGVLNTGILKRHGVQNTKICKIVTFRVCGGIYFIRIAWQSGLFKQAQLTWKGVKVNRLPYSLRSNGFRGANY